MDPTEPRTTRRDTSNPFAPPDASVEPTTPEPPERPVKSSVSSGAPFEVDCPSCGQTVGVHPSDAGSYIDCQCRAEISVPTLGRLRQAAGRGAYESNTVDTIRRMIEAGQLPQGDRCVWSRVPTDRVLPVTITLPRYEMVRDTSLNVVRVFLLGPILGSLLGYRQGTGYAEEGTIVVRVPLRVAPGARDQVRYLGSSRLKRLLRTVPIYAQLLKERPDARVSCLR